MMIASIGPETAVNIGSLDCTYAKENDLLPENDAGTTIARMVLSALALTRRFADGLNFSAVGGKEWAWRILSSGYSEHRDEWMNDSNDRTYC